MITALGIYAAVGLLVCFVVLGYLATFGIADRDLRKALASAFGCGLLWLAVCVTLVVDIWVRNETEHPPQAVA